MGNIFASILSILGLLDASAGETTCPHFWLDEPEMPRSMIK